MSDQGATVSAAGLASSRFARGIERIAAMLGRGGFVVLRQLPFTVLYLMAMGTLSLSPVVSPPGLAVASGLVVLPLLLAGVLPWHRWPVGAQDALPVAQIVAVAFLRAATGGQGSPYTSLVFVPVVALGVQPGRRGPIVGAAGVAAVILGPVLVASDVPLTGDVVVRAGFVSLVGGMIALTVHLITDWLRSETATATELRAREQRLLDQLRQDADELARVADLRRAARDQLVSVIDSATEQAIIASDARGVIEVFNRGAERLLGWRAAEVVGTTSLTDLHRQDELEARRGQLVPDAPAAAEPRSLLEALVARAGQAETRDWTYVRRDGGEVTVRLAVTRRVDVDGSVVGYVVVATDVTAEREANALKDQFLSLVSHELRTPLTSVLGYLELLADDELTDEQREYVDVIERNARRQLRLVGDLLLTAQLDAGSFAVSPQRVDAADVVLTSVQSAAPQAELAGVALTTQVEPASVHADPVRLGQAVDNLLSNAVKFTPRGGRVSVVVGPAGPDARGEPGGVRIAVTDTGIGIPPDELDRLTGRFFRASTATRRAIPGVGLGLSISKAVVEAHGGDLGVTSTLGEGTTFTISLPPLA